MNECRELLDNNFPPEEREEIINLQPRMVLVVCFAGQNRSRLIAEVLEQKGYAPTHGGVRGAHPLVDEDLIGSQAIIFATKHDQKFFNDRFPGYINVPQRIIGLRDSPVARKLERGEREVKKLKKGN